MDGLQDANGVLVLAASNRPSAVDAALLRPGRVIFSKIIFIDRPFFAQ